MKSHMNVKSGYTFIVCEEISTMFPGKDTFLHGKICPWADYMDLEPGDEVNWAVNKKMKVACYSLFKSRIRYLYHQTLEASFSAGSKPICLQVNIR